MFPFWILLELMVMEIGDGGENWSYKTCKAPTTPSFLQAGCPSCCPINSIRALKENMDDKN